MNTHIRLLVCLQLLLCMPVSAQLSLERNGLRAGDEILKQRVSFNDPGRSGEACLWNFSELEIKDEAYPVSYRETGGTRVAGREHHTDYHYRQQGDSLLLCGLENRQVLLRYHMPEFLLHYPVSYGDSAGSFFHATGIYCDKIRLEEGGYTYTKADGMGLLVLPSKDTLRNVQRTHTVKRFTAEEMPVAFSAPKDSLLRSYPMTADSLRLRLAKDSLQMETQTFRWYVPGYRYPVFESVIHSEITGGRRDTVFATSFFCPLREQLLPEDRINDQVRDSLLRIEENVPVIAEEKRETPHPVVKQGSEPQRDIFYNVYPNPVKDRLQVELYLPRAVEIEYAVYTLSGELAYRNRQAGVSGMLRETIDFSGRPPGEYLLYIKAGEKEFSGKILKR